MAKKLESHLPSRIEMAIGRFIANFSLLEDWLREVILYTPNLSSLAGEILTAELSFRGLLNACGAIIHEYSNDPEILRLTDEVIPKIYHMNDFRNQLVHSLLYGDMENRQLAFRGKAKASRRKGAQYSLQEFRQEDLLEKCDELALLTGKIKDIHDKITAKKSV